MVIYFSGSTFNQVINEVVNSTNALIFPPEVSNEIDFQKNIKQNISKYEDVDTLILDESACKNTEEELLTSLEMIRTLYDHMKIIVFAPYRETGDGFLTKCFNMGILNIINTSDFLEIRRELEHCLVEGKTYRESVKYKDEKKEKVIVKHEIRRTVNKRLIGVAGVESNIGVTHNAIVLANFFRKNGFMVALVEMNASRAFDGICESFGEKKFQEGYFTLNGIDFFANCNPVKLPSVMEHSYNVILIDFGTYENCDRIAFERCEDRLIIAGSKPWELEATDKVFELASKDVLIKYVFCFNFTQKSDYQSIRDGMGDIENVHFLEFTEDPFASSAFADAEIIFDECLPEKNAEDKRTILKKIFNRKKVKIKNDEK